MLADLNNLMMGLGIALQPYNLFIACIGLILGIIVGVLPGLGGANGVAILIPVVVVMPATTGCHSPVKHLLGGALRGEHHIDSL